MSRYKLPILIFILIILAAIAGYLTFFKKPTKSSTTTASAKLFKLSDDSAISPVPAFNGDAIWYFNSNGQLFRRGLNGESLTEFSLPSLVPDFRKAVWPPSGNDFILVSTGNTGDIKNLYSNSSQQYKLLPQNIQSFDWMPDGKKIVYIWKSGDNIHQQLMVANSDTSGYRVIKDVYWPDLTVKVSPDGQNVLLIRSNIQETNKIYEANLITGEFTTVVDSGKNTAVTWVDADRFIYVQQISGKNTLKLFDLKNNQATDLAVEATLNKAAITKDGKYMYVSISNGQAEAIWKVDLATAQKSMVYQFDNTIHPSYVFMDDQIICFVNAADNKLYTVTQ